MTTTKKTRRTQSVGLCFVLTTVLSLIKAAFYCSRGVGLGFGHGSRLWWGIAQVIPVCL